MAELEGMAAFAASNGVGVSMGFNKNVSPYVLAALKAAAEIHCEAETGECARVAFVHKNAYRPDQLAECFARNHEGLLKNMAIHELALLVTYFGVRSDNLMEVTVDKECSSSQTLGGITDFARVGFTVITAAGRSVSVFADRCGDPGGLGSSEAVVTSHLGHEMLRSVAPDEALRRAVTDEMRRHPDWMPYFLVHAADYAALKERVCRAVLTRDPEPKGVASISVAIETLKLAEALKPRLMEQLSNTCGGAEAAAGGGGGWSPVAVF